jgi:hypothetical protein
VIKKRRRRRRKKLTFLPSGLAMGRLRLLLLPTKSVAKPQSLLLLYH